MCFELKLRPIQTVSTFAQHPFNRCKANVERSVQTASPAGTSQLQEFLVLKDRGILDEMKYFLSRYPSHCQLFFVIRFIKCTQM